MLHAHPAHPVAVCGRLAMIGLAALAALSSCGKDGPPKPAPNFFPPEPPIPKPDLTDLLPVEPDDATAAKAPPADTWAGKIKDLVATAEADLQRCRNEYLIPFQFNNMRRRDVMFVNINEMDEVCELGTKDRKVRGPRKLIEVLAKEHLGRHPLVDRFVVLGLEQVESYHVFSYMTKKIGAPDIDVVVGIAQKSQARILELAPQLDLAAAEVAKISDGQQPDDDPAVIGAAIDAAAFRQQLIAAYAPVVADLAAGYERMGDKSWQNYDMPKMAVFRAWTAVLEKRAQQDRARLAKVAADPKQLAEFTAFFAAVEAAARQIAAGFDFYEKKPRDERPERDPNFKAVKAAHKAALKFLTGWGYAGGS